MAGLRSTCRAHTRPAGRRSRVPRYFLPALLSVAIAWLASTTAARPPEPADAPLTLAEGATHRQARAAVPPVAQRGSISAHPLRPFFPFDADADGVPDAITRELRRDPAHPAVSAMVTRSGVDAMPLQVFTAPESNDLFGWLVVCLGDLNADAIADLAVSAPVALNRPGSWGRVHVVSGATGQILRTIATEEAGMFGLGLVVVADADADAMPDLLIGCALPLAAAPVPDPASTTEGAPLPNEPQGGVYYAAPAWRVVSSATGAVLSGGDGHPDPSYFLAGESPAALWLSSSVPGERLWLPAVEGDLNGDGVVNRDDLTTLLALVGEPEAAARGHAEPALPSLSPLGDLNRDGSRDIRDLLVLLVQYGRSSEEIVNDRPPSLTAARLNCEIELCDYQCDSCAWEQAFGPGGSGGGPPQCHPGDPDCDDPCLSLPCQPGCSAWATCACSGDPCACNPGSCQCVPCCADPCGASCDADGDGIPNAQDCDDQGGCSGSPPGGGGVGCDPCDDDDADGRKNQNDCDSACYQGPEENCAPLDLRADVNNDGEINDDDEEIEDDAPAMAVLIVNRGDSDGDAIPGFADGFGQFGPDSISSGSSPSAQLQLQLPQGVDLTGATLSFEYLAADPSQASQYVVEVPDIESSYSRYSPGPGRLRIWKLPPSQPRTLADFIPSAEPIPLDELGLQPEFFVEAAGGWASALEVTARVTLADGTSTSDTVRLLPLDPLWGVWVPAIAGFTIAHGSAAGGAGRNLIIGSPGNDLIDGGGGDDILIAGDGDDLIIGGPGADVIFASLGHNEVYYGSVGSAREPLLRQGPDSTTVIDEEGKPDATAAALAAYRMLYGENDPWLHIYLTDDELRGRVHAVEVHNWLDRLLTRQYWDSGFDQGTNTWDFTIQIEFDPARPLRSAAALRQQLLDLAGRNGHAKRAFEGAFFQDLMDIANGQDNSDPDAPLLLYDQLRAMAAENAFAASAKLAELYVTSIGFVNEGADFVLTVNAVANGQISASVGFLPFVPASAASSGKVLLLWGGVATFEKIRDRIRRYDILIARESQIGVVMQRNMPWRDIVSAGGQRTLLLGTAQEVYTKYGSTQHASTVLRIAEELAASGQYEYITMNRAWKTAVTRNPPITPLSTRPDIIAVKRTGKVDAFEVASEGQEELDLLNRLIAEMNSLPHEIQGSVRTFPLDP